MKRTIFHRGCSFAGYGRCCGRRQRIDIQEAGEKPSIAVPDFRGAGAAQTSWATFNQTLFSQLQDSSTFKMVPKTVYPLQDPAAAHRFPGRP